VNEYLTVEEVATRLRVKPLTVRRWVASGRLRAYQPGRRILIDVNDLLILISHLPAPDDAEGGAT
jgi:excisionase family DNA binding protein